MPVTNTGVTKAMTTGGKLLDARLARTNGIFSKAFVPIAKLLSDVGEKKCRPTEYFLPDLNSNLKTFDSRI